MLRINNEGTIIQAFQIGIQNYFHKTLHLRCLIGF